jgi:hypothetical protein
MRTALPGLRERRGDGGYALLDAVVALGIVALFALLALAGFARGALRARAAAIEFDALMARVEAAANGAASRDPAAPASSGLTITVRATAAGAEAAVYRGRPGPGVALPLQPETAIVPVWFDGVSSDGVPFSIFVGGTGSLRTRPGFDAASSLGTIESEPPCPAAGVVTIVFRDLFREETDEFACSNGHGTSR